MLKFRNHSNHISIVEKSYKIFKSNANLRDIASIDGLYGWFGNDAILSITRQNIFHIHID